MPDVSGRGRGDLFFTVQAVTPKKLTREQRAALEQLSQAMPKETFAPRPSRETEGVEGEEKNLFDKVKDIFG
jgi:DnaJ-class molecular chaperone